ASPDPAVPVSYSLDVCDSGAASDQRNCNHLETVALTPDFYKADRSMRESGFDPSFRFGPYDGDTHHYAPVCLNSLLYKTEKDLEQFAGLLGKEADARQWGQRAEQRREAINKWLWDPQRRLFYDYDFQKQARSTYNYISTFYPLWAGLASPEQARAVDANLRIFEHPGGLAMSDPDT